MTSPTGHIRNTNQYLHDNAASHAHVQEVNADNQCNP